MKTVLVKYRFKPILSLIKNFKSAHIDDLVWLSYPPEPGYFDPGRKGWISTVNDIFMCAETKAEKELASKLFNAMFELVIKINTSKPNFDLRVTWAIVVTVDRMLLFPLIKKDQHKKISFLCGEIKKMVSQRLAELNSCSDRDADKLLDCFSGSTRLRSKKDIRRMDTELVEICRSHPFCR